MSATPSGPANKIVAALVLVGALAAGGIYLIVHNHHDRSVATYCQTFYSEGEQVQQEYQPTGNTGDPLAALGNLISAPSQLATLFAKLQAVAPSDIEPDVAQLQQALQQEANSEDSGDLLGGLVQGIALGASTQQAENNVNAWTLKHCGPPPGS
jgi:hypothetical protein